MSACASRPVSFGSYPGWRTPHTGTLTPGCQCDRCVMLRLPWLYALAEALACIACAVLMKRFVPHLCTGLHPKYRVA